MTLNTHKFHTRFFTGDCPVPVPVIKGLDNLPPLFTGDCPVPVIKELDNLPPLYRDGVNYLEVHLKKYPGGAVPLKCLGEGTASSYSIMIYKTENQHTNKIERK